MYGTQPNMEDFPQSSSKSSGCEVLRTTQPKGCKRFIFAPSHKMVDVGDELVIGHPRFGRSNTRPSRQSQWTRPDTAAMPLLSSQSPSGSISIQGSAEKNGGDPESLYGSSTSSGTALGSATHAVSHDMTQHTSWIRMYHLQLLDGAYVMKAHENADFTPIRRNLSPNVSERSSRTHSRVVQEHAKEGCHSEQFQDEGRPSFSVLVGRVDCIHNSKQSCRLVAHQRKERKQFTRSTIFAFTKNHKNVPFSERPSPSVNQLRRTSSSRI